MKSARTNLSFQSPVFFSRGLPRVPALVKACGAKNLVLLVDKRLLADPRVQAWSKTFRHVLSVTAGETLKQIENFAPQVAALLPHLAGFAPQENGIVALGGGSVGDCAGFLASVVKRGVKFINIPSTWLAVVDSAHGGKTALNVGEFKNQVGTFYPAHAIFCVQDILNLQGQENLRSAYGEALKMAILEGGTLYNQLAKLKNFNAQSLWRLLPSLIAAKYRIVKKDPLETKGLRHLLNLGHTVGHVFELEQLLPHGLAVQSGLEFAIEWSRQRELLPLKGYNELKSLFAKNHPVTRQPLNASRFRLRLQQDKKATAGDHLRFVFVARPGQPRIEEVRIDDIVTAARALGWAQ